MGAFEAYQRRAISLDGGSGPAALAAAVGGLRELEAEVASAGMTAAERRSLTFTLSSVMINLASDAGSVEDLRAGVTWATRLLHDGEAPAALVAQAGYNRANGLEGIFAAEEARRRAGPAGPDQAQGVRRRRRSVGHAG